MIATLTLKLILNYFCKFEKTVEAFQKFFLIQKCVYFNQMNESGYFEKGRQKSGSHSSYSKII
jgi:hypothetical protein